MYIIELMPETPTSDKPQSENTLQQIPEVPKVSRRHILKGLTAAALIGTIPDSLKHIPSITEESPLVKLKRETEDRYNIELPDENPIYSSTMPAKWERQYLEQFARVLPALPEHLFQSSDSKTKLVFLLCPKGGAYSGITTKENGETRVNIQLGRDQFNKDDKQVLELLAHEITHYLDKDRSLFRAIDQQIFEGKFSEIVPELKAKAEEISRQHQKFSAPIALVEPDVVSQERHLFSRFDYMLRQNEFVPILAEHYIQGKDQFLLAFMGLFERQTVEALYDFARREIFQEREY